MTDVKRTRVYTRCPLCGRMVQVRSNGQLARHELRRDLVRYRHPRPLLAIWLHATAGDHCDGPDIVRFSNGKVWYQKRDAARMLIPAIALYLEASRR